MKPTRSVLDKIRDLADGHTRLADGVTGDTMTGEGMACWERTIELLHALECPITHERYGALCVWPSPHSRRRHHPLLDTDAVVIDARTPRGLDPPATYLLLDPPVTDREALAVERLVFRWLTGQLSGAPLVDAAMTPRPGGAPPAPIPDRDRDALAERIERWLAAHPRGTE